MKALLVYESSFGNTKKIAEEVAAGLRASADVTVTEVSSAPASPGDLFDLLVVGGPTHALSMSRPKTRTEAVAKGAPAGVTKAGIREWLSSMPSYSRRTRVATFDTKAATARHLPGSAAKSAARSARRRGFSVGSAPMSFFVQDIPGPLLPGELERAREWGRHLCQTTDTS